jgi:hypothetical protein
MQFATYRATGMRIIRGLTGFQESDDPSDHWHATFTKFGARSHFIWQKWRVVAISLANPATVIVNPK